MLQLHAINRVAVSETARRVVSEGLQPFYTPELCQE